MVRDGYHKMKTPFGHFKKFKGYVRDPLSNPISPRNGNQNLISFVRVSSISGCGALYILLGHPPIDITPQLTA